MTDNMQRAREPKFGDWIRGIYASERNPIRDGIYVRTTRRNHETLYELTDGKGKFWMYPKRSTERLDRPNAFDAAALRLAVPEDTARLDALEALVNEQPDKALLLHHGLHIVKEGQRSYAGLGLSNTGRTLRQAIDSIKRPAAPTVSAEGER